MVKWDCIFRTRHFSEEHFYLNQCGFFLTFLFLLNLTFFSTGNEYKVIFLVPRQCRYFSTRSFLDGLKLPQNFLEGQL